MIAGLLVGILAIDGARLRSAHAKLTSAEWSAGVVWGVAVGVLLLVVAGVLWLVTRRFKSLDTPIQVAGAVVAVSLLVVTHPRGIGNNWVDDQEDLALLIATDVLISAVLMYAAAYRWTRPPVSPSP